MARSQSVQPGDWPVFDRDPQRSGTNADETAISAATVGGLQRLWTQTLPELSGTAPILLAGMQLADGSIADLLYLTSSHGITMAVNAQSGALVWQQNTNGPRIDNQRCQICASPAADPSREWIYAAGNDAAVHKYAAATGQEDTSSPWPVPVTLMNGFEKRSSSLNVANGELYVAMSGYNGDFGPYVGHVVSINLADGSSTVFNVLCSDQHQLLAAKNLATNAPASCDKREAGVWARAGVVVDQGGGPTDGSLFIATGNGPFDAASGGVNYGDSVLRLSSDGGTLLDSYTPASFQELDDRDADLGSTAPALLPRQSRGKTPWLLVQGGKDSIVRLLDRTHLGGVGGELQTVNTNTGVILTAPAVWLDPAAGDPNGDNTWVFVTDARATFGYHVVTDGSGATTLQQAWKASEGGTSPIVAGGVLFSAVNNAVTARDPYTGNVLWRSSQSQAGGSIGGIHWQSPIVAGGRLYIPDEDGHLTAYGLPGR
ncbi:MAG: outer membrane protein assembly factor BamB family protein [Dehalococcoidia bacterium]